MPVCSHLQSLPLSPLHVLPVCNNSSVITHPTSSPPALTLRCCLLHVQCLQSALIDTHIGSVCMFDHILWLHVWNLWLIPWSSQMNPLNCALLLVLAGFRNNFHSSSSSSSLFFSLTHTHTLLCTPRLSLLTDTLWATQTKSNCNVVFRNLQFVFCLTYLLTTMTTNEGNCQKWLKSVHTVILDILHCKQSVSSFSAI